MEVSGQFNAPVALSPRKEPPVPIGYEPVWVKGPVWTLWSTETFFAPTWNRSPVFQTADVPTEPSRLRRLMAFRKKKNIYACSENQIFSTSKLYSVKASGIYTYRCTTDKQFRNILVGSEGQLLVTSV
jgi:hypothetical protein